MITKGHIQFIAWFAGIFLVSFSVLYGLGLIPSELLGGDQPNSLGVFDNSVVSEDQIPTIVAPSQTKREYHGEFPTHITIKSIGVSASISNPTKSDAATLDANLTHGAVRYPGSGLLADGNVFIFGHSTNWSVVNNPAYKTFNGFKDLKAGDDIEVKGSEHTFVYKVVSVTLANDDQIWVDLGSDEKLLTLSTCNTFGKKQERYVVKAQYSSEY